MSHKHAMIGKTEIARKQLGLDDDAFREILLTVTGHSSRKDCSEAQLSRLIDHFAQCGAVFTSAQKHPDKGFKVKASQRRSDFYEIPDGPHARQKRFICAMWRELGYDMTSLDTRVKRQLGIDAFRWCNDPAFLQTLGKDLQSRLTRKKKQTEARA